MTTPRGAFALPLLLLAGCGADPRPVVAPAPAPAPLEAPRSPVEPVAPDLASRIDPLFSKYASPKTPGCAVAVVRAGQVDFARGYGAASLAYDRAITPATRFPIASLSKQMTAAAVVLLAHDGKLALGDDVRRWIPELPDYGKPITLDHLLHHTSGVRDLVQLLPLAGHAEADSVTADEILWLLTRQRSLNFPPGTDHVYSNSGYFLLSLVVQRAAGEPLSVFEKERLFDPLGMTETTSVEDPFRVVAGLATGYRATADGRFAVATRNVEAVGYANVATTVGDLARWDGLFYDARVGGQALVDALRAPGTLEDGTPLRYARGLVVGVAHGRRFERHGGYLPGFRTEMLRYPADRLTVVVLCNDVGAEVDDLADQVAAAALPPPDRGARAAVEAPAVAPFETSFLGTYLARERGDVRVFAETGGHLTVEMPLLGGARERLATLGAREVKGEESADRWTFEAAAGKAAARVVRRRVDGPPVTYVRVERVAEVPGAELAQLAGRYTSDEVGRDQAVTLRRDQLFVGPWGGATSSKALRPLSRDTFMLGARLFSFERQRGAGGKVTGVEISSERVWRVKLARSGPASTPPLPLAPAVPAGHAAPDAAVPLHGLP